MRLKLVITLAIYSVLPLLIVIAAGCTVLYLNQTYSSVVIEDGALGRVMSGPLLPFRLFMGRWGWVVILPSILWFMAGSTLTFASFTRSYVNYVRAKNEKFRKNFQGPSLKEGNCHDANESADQRREQP